MPKNGSSGPQQRLLKICKRFHYDTLIFFFLQPKSSPAAVLSIIRHQLKTVMVKALFLQALIQNAVQSG